MAETLRKYLDMPLRVVMALDVNTLPTRDAICVTMIYQALVADGERDRIHVFDRLDGKPKQSVEVEDKLEPAYIEELRRIRERLGANGATPDSDGHG